MPSSPHSSAGDLLALPAGHEINEYRLERVLGFGGFGITYLAFDTHLECPVAIKEYLPRALAARGTDQSVRPHSPESGKSFAWGLDRFLLESRALASFHHRAIVRVLRYFRANETAYMVMEYERGEPLDAWLTGRLPVDRATLLRIVGPLLDGLEVIHQAGFLHRDIKPRNIYVRTDGSPVLLDFGSARRLRGDEQLLTAIVTPGFAPAEQYQPDGRQGTWSDLYALGGVMYWLVTGSPPRDALSRLREDPMPPAAQAASSAVYGDALLRAIDWALTPDAKLRPRLVADFRRACVGAPAADGVPPRPATAKPASPILSANQECNVVGVVLFADVLPLVTGTDETAIGEHRERRSRLATLLSQAVSAVPASTRLAANTKEGCAVCYVGDPEDALRTATQVMAAAGERGLALQIGINLGPVRVQPDTGGRSRILGDGIAIAYRVMRFAEPGQVLVSAVYRELVGQLRSSAADSFAYVGHRVDSQAREHELYRHLGQVPEAGQETTSERRPSAAAGDVSPAAVAAAERLLSQHIGPLARILVARTLPCANSLDELHQLLAALIPDSSARDAFVAGVMAVPRSPSTHADQTGGRSAPPTTAPHGVPGLPSAPVTPSAIRDTDLERVGQLLARQIGPLAKILLRREAARAADLESLCRALATQIDKEEDRKRFLSETGIG